jgi:hypoxanthine phosphoribosyltransferase
MIKRATPRPSKRARKNRAAASTPRLKTLVTEKDVRKRVREMAKQINRDYAGKTLHVVGILEDSFVFVADLVRALTMPVFCSFVRFQVRDSNSGPVPMREIMSIPPVEAAGKDLLVVGGVLQSGLTLDHLCRTLLVQQPTSLRTAALVDKAEDRKVDVTLDYAGFELSRRFVVGYGLGYHDQFRNLPFLARVAE